MPKRKKFFYEENKKKKQKNTSTDAIDVKNNNNNIALTNFFKSKQTTINSFNSEKVITLNTTTLSTLQTENDLSILNILPAEIWWLIFDNLSWKNIYSLRITSKLFYEMIGQFLKKQFNNFLENKMISVGGRFQTTFIRTRQGNVWVCGRNDMGQLGIKGLKNRRVPQLLIQSVAQVSAGFSNDCIFRLKNGEVFAYSNNISGALGFGDIHPRIIPSKIPLSFLAQKVVIGQNNTFIFDEEGKVWGCGDNSYNQLGLEITYTISFLKLPIKSVKQVYSRPNFTLFLLNDGKVMGCGNGLIRFGLKNLSKPFMFQNLLIDSVKEIIAGGKEIFFQKEDGVWVFDADSIKMNVNSLAKFKKLPIESVKKVFAGTRNAFFLLENGEVLSCGRNDRGQLGLGCHEYSVKTPMKVPIEASTVVQIIAGVDHTLFLLKDGRVFGCGSNQYGQLSLNVKIEKVLRPQELPALTERLGLHALYKEIEKLSPANISKQESNSSESRKNTC